MVHGLIGIVLRRAAPLKLLNYKLTRRSRSTASVIRFATLESRLSRFSRPCKVVSRTTIDFSPDLAPRIRRAKNHPPDYFSFFSHLLFPPPDEVRFTDDEMNNIIRIADTNERIKFARVSLVSRVCPSFFSFS